MGANKYMRGLIVRNDKNWVVVSYDEKNYLLIEKVINYQGKIITDKLKVGDRFYTPQKYLDKQFKNRTKFKSFGKL